MAEPKIPDFTWGSLVAWVCGIAALLGSLRKIKRAVIPWIKRFVDMPEEIVRLSHAAREQQSAQIAALSDSIHLMGARVRMVQELSNIAVLELDKNGLANYASPSALTILGRGQEECRGNAWWSAVYSDDRDGSDRSGPRTRWERGQPAGERFEENVIIKSQHANVLARFRLEIVPLTSPDARVLGWKVLLRPESVAERRASV